MATAILQPSSSATKVFEDHQVEVYSDGTWVAKLPRLPYMAHDDAVIYSSGRGAAKITAASGRRKVSRVTGPDGTLYDFQSIARNRA